MSIKSRTTSDGVSSTQTAAGSDTVEGTENTTVLVQMEEVMRAIQALPFVTKLSPVGGRNSHGDGYRVTLRCPSCEEYGSCGKKQESPVQVSSRHPTLHACLQKLLKRLQEKHGKCAEALTKKAAADAQAAAAVHTPNVMQAMMLFQQAQHRAKARSGESRQQGCSTGGEGQRCCSKRVA